MKAELEQKTNLLEMVRFAWAARFNLPPNDPRLLQATAREALEQINGSRAFEQLVQDASSKQREDSARDAIEDGTATPAQHAFMGGQVLDDEGNPTATIDRRRMVTVRGPEAEKVADTPHLTAGTKFAWDEWDELELAETDPTKEPLKIQW